MSELVVGDVVVPEWAGHSLEENEEIISRGLTTFVEVGRALAVIRDERQYIAAGFDTFEDYCRERWDLSLSYANGQIDAARVVSVVSSRAEIEPPRTEFHARPLVKVLNNEGEDATVQVWFQILEAHVGDGPITGREVNRFFKLGGTHANYGKPGWREMLGEIGDTFARANRQLERVEAALTRAPNKDFRERAARYADMAYDLHRRLRAIEGGEWR